MQADIPEEKWAQAFEDDINKGCDGTDIKAGILKAAMDKEGPTPSNIKTHHAVGYGAGCDGEKDYASHLLPYGDAETSAEFA